MKFNPKNPIPGAPLDTVVVRVTLPSKLPDLITVPPTVFDVLALPGVNCFRFTWHQALDIAQTYRDGLDGLGVPVIYFVKRLSYEDMQRLEAAGFFGVNNS